MAPADHAVTANSSNDPARRLNVRKLGGQLLGLTISVACIAYVVSKIDLAALGRVLLHFHLQWLGLGLMSLAAGYAMRIARWMLMLRSAGAAIGFRACVAPFLGSIALNNVLPFRTGDIIRALVFPARLGLERTTSTASLLLERVMDLAALVLCLGAGLALLEIPVLISSYLEHAIVFTSIATFLILALLLFASGRTGVILHRLGQIAAERRLPAVLSKALWTGSTVFYRMQAMSRPGVLAGLCLVSIPVWMGEAGLYFCLMKGLDVSRGWAGGLTVMAMTTLSTMVPSTPGYIGPFHLAAFGAASMLGVEAATAGAFAVLAHSALWATTTLAGAMAIVTDRSMFARAESKSLQA